MFKVLGKPALTALGLTEGQVEGTNPPHVTTLLETETGTTEGRIDLEYTQPDSEEDRITRRERSGELCPGEEADEPASLTILTPTTLETVSGTYDFTAEYLDDDETEDLINWAVYFESCSFTGTNRVAGNAEGDSSSFIGGMFSTTLVTSDWANGEYCFVVNPSEAGQR